MIANLVPLELGGNVQDNIKTILSDFKDTNIIKNEIEQELNDHKYKYYNISDNSNSIYLYNFDSIVGNFSCQTIPRISLDDYISIGYSNVRIGIRVDNNVYDITNCFFRYRGKDNNDMDIYH